MDPMVYIYADESCLGNQYTDRDNPGGAGALVELWMGGAWVRRDLCISSPGTTNNRRALAGATAVLDRLTRPCRVVFTSDSQYLVKGMREWVPGWVRRNWKRKAGPVENVELWKELLRAARKHQVDWRWVKGHAGHPQNEYANHLATRAAKEQTETPGLVASAYTQWLESEREKDRYMEVFEFQPPGDTGFRPAPVPQKG